MQQEQQPVILNKKIKKSSEPEYPVQKELEGSLLQSYNKMLRAMSVATLITVGKSIVDNSKQ